MWGDTVLVRAYKGKPLERKVWSIGKRSVMLCNPGLFDAVQNGEAWPLGFPVEDVFQFDSVLYDGLAKAYNDGQQEKLSKLWANARLYIEGLKPV